MEVAKKLPQKKRISIATLVTIALFVAILVVGLLTYQDYGFTIDENIQRDHSIISYQYAVNKLAGINLEVDHRNLLEYKHRMYGVALQLPMVFVEHITDFSMDIRDVFVMRHLFTFLICYIGYICFYLFATKVFSNRWLALLGTLMLVVYPRFWGEQFSNIKDMVFMATCCASMLCVALCLEHEGKWRYEVLAGFVFAICANTRIVGLMIPGLLFGYRVLRDLCIDNVFKKQGAPKLWSNVGRYAAQVLLLFIFYVAMTPAAWENPVAFLTQVFTTFSNYSTYYANVQFLGNWFSPSGLPKYYLPVWLGISLPLWYLALLAVSIPCVAVAVVLKRKQWFGALFTEYKYYLLCFVVAFFPILWACIKDVTLYNGWRHTYYILPFLVVMMLYGARFVWRTVQNKWPLQALAIGAACVLLAFEGAFIVRNHPFERVYFNPLGKMVANGVDRDYWSETFYAQYQYLLTHDASATIHVLLYDHSEEVARCYLSPEDRTRIVMETEADGAAYIIDREDSRLPKVIDAFVPLHQIEVDGIVVSTLYVRKDVFEQRYHGQIPE